MAKWQSLILIPFVFSTSVSFGENSPLAKKIIDDHIAPVNIGEAKKPKNAAIDAETQACLNDELTVSQIEESILFPLANAIQTKKIDLMNQLAAGKVKGLGRASSATKTVDGISEFNWDAKQNLSWADFSAKFNDIEYVEIRAADYSIDPVDRKGPQDLKISLRLRLDIRGKMDGKRTQDRGYIQAVAIKEKSGWKISSMRALEGTTLVQNRKPAFVEVTESSHISKAQIYRRTEAIRRGGYALSVTDINGDGIPDIFIGMKGAPEIWLGNKDGTYTKMENNPFKNERFTKTAVFADFNNTGSQDVVMTRYVNSKNSPIKGNNSPAVDVAIYDRKDGKFVLDEKKMSGNPDFREPMPSAVADFNGDGFLDIYVGYPGRQDFSQLGPSQSVPLNKVQGLYINDQKGHFNNFADSLLKWNDSNVYDGHLFPHSSLAADFNQDGKQDLLVVDDRGNLSPLFINQGNGKLSEKSFEYGIENHGYSMSIATGDINNSGRTDIALTNVYFTEFERLKVSCRRHFNEGVLEDKAQGLRLFQAKPDNHYVDITESVIKDYVGDGAAGVTFIDYNNDGNMDMYVANGLWSGTSKGQSLGSMFTALVRITNQGFYSLRSGDSLHFMDLLSSFKGVISDYANSKTVKDGNERPSLAGFQRNRLFRNNGDGTFTEVGYLEGADSMADGYIVARADLNHDGKMDLVLRNADPGTDDYQFPVVQIYQNQYEGPNKSATLTFTGTKSNRDGYGLFAKATIGKATQVQHLIANSGSVQDQKILSFGMGEHKVIDRLEVHWPSGIVQVLTNVEPGYHQITEPGINVNVGSTN